MQVLVFRLVQVEHTHLIQHVQRVQQGAHLAVAPMSVVLAVQATFYMEVLVCRLVQVEHTLLIQHV